MAECQNCHGAGSNSNLIGGNPIISDLTFYSNAMNSVSPLTDEEVLNLQAYIDSL